jgi:hypothetical protein
VESGVWFDRMVFRSLFWKDVMPVTSWHGKGVCLRCGGKYGLRTLVSSYTPNAFVLLIARYIFMSIPVIVEVKSKKQGER